MPIINYKESLTLTAPVASEAWGRSPSSIGTKYGFYEGLKTFKKAMDNPNKGPYETEHYELINKLAGEDKRVVILAGFGTATLRIMTGKSSRLKISNSYNDDCSSTLKKRIYQRVLKLKPGTVVFVDNLEKLSPLEKRIYYLLNANFTLKRVGFNEGFAAYRIEK